MTKAPLEVIHIDGIRPSADIRAELAAGDPILLAFSCGKDSLAAWVALRDSGVTVVPYYLYLIPGLRFVQESLDRYEQVFQQRIVTYPHPSLLRMLNAFVFQPPERLATIEAAALPDVDYIELVGYIREEHGLPADAWVADGVRAADSIDRRVSIVRNGPMKANRKVSVVWDWRKAHVYEALKRANVPLPPDYDWFGRSFDGIDYRFLEPLSRFAPDDYARIVEWFPLVEMELLRHGV